MYAERGQPPRFTFPQPRSPRLSLRWVGMGKIAFTLASLAVFGLGLASEVSDAVPWERVPSADAARTVPQVPPAVRPTEVVVVPAPGRRSTPGAPGPNLCRPAGGP